MRNNDSLSDSGNLINSLKCLIILSFLFVNSISYSAPTKPTKVETEKKGSILLKFAYINMQMGNGKIHIDGMVSSQEERDVLVNAVIARVGENNLIDTLKISEKVTSADWISKVKGLISTMVEGVSLSVKDGDIQLTGSIDGTKARYTAVKQLTETSAKSGLNLDNKIEIGSISSVLKITTKSNTVVLTGELPNQTLINTFVNRSQKAFGTATIVNNISVSDNAVEPLWLQAVVQLLVELKNIENGTLTVSDESLMLTGLFQTEDVRSSLHHKVKSRMNTDYNGTITVNALTLPSFNLRMGNGMIHIDGTVSSDAERNILLKSAVKRVGSENVINTLKVNEKITPANWINEIATMTESYIDGGWFSVKDKEVALMGTVDDSNTYKKVIRRFKLALTNTDVAVIDRIRVNLVESESEMITFAKPIQKSVTEVVTKTRSSPATTNNEKIKSVCQGMLDHVMKSNTIRFPTNNAIIKLKSYPLLDNLSNVLKECAVVIPDKGVTISGHTDSRGDATYNMTLSQLRADSVERYLLKAGVHSTLITTVGYGEEQPIVPENTAENKAQARAQNRRITIQIKRK